MLSKNCKILKTTWAMKMKPNGKFQACINACRYEQVDSLNFDSTNIAPPATNDKTIRIMYTLVAMAN
jgi:hypothetical protein